MRGDISVQVSLPTSGADGLAVVGRAVAQHGLDGVIMAGLENLMPEQDQRMAEALRPLAESIGEFYENYGDGHLLQGYLTPVRSRV